jgi:hypothetical protein
VPMIGVDVANPGGLTEEVGAAFSAGG